MPHADELGVEDVAEVVSDIFGINFKKKHDEAHFLCVVHNDSNPSADCNLKTGLWSCFSCGAAGDLIDLGVATIIEGGILYRKDLTKQQRRKRMEQREQVQKMLVPDTPDAFSAATRRRLKANLKKVREVERKESRKSLSIPPLGSYEDGPLDSLYARGFSDDHLQKWNVRYVTSTLLAREDGTEFEITHSVAVPILERDESIVGWMYRSTEQSQSWQPRWLFTPGLQTSQHWFGLQHSEERGEVIVVEGQADAMFLNQLGYSAIANLGTALPRGKKLHALTRFKRVTIFPDRDLPGVKFARVLGPEIMSLGIPCQIVRYPKEAEGKDPNEIGSEHSVRAVERAIPFAAWSRGAKRRSTPAWR